MRDSFGETTAKVLGSFDDALSRAHDRAARMSSSSVSSARVRPEPRRGDEVPSRPPLRSANVVPRQRLSSRAQRPANVKTH